MNATIQDLVKMMVRVQEKGKEKEEGPNGAHTVRADGGMWFQHEGLAEASRVRHGTWQLHELDGTFHDVYDDASMSCGKISSSSCRRPTHRCHVM